MERSRWWVIPATLGMVAMTSCNLIEDNTQYIAPVAAEIVLLNVPADNLEAYGIDAQPSTTLYVAIGRLTDGSTTSSSPFSGEGVADATVTVTTPDGNTFSLALMDSAPGFYSLTSQDEPGLQYVVGGEYTVNLSFSGQEYWAKLTAADTITLTSPAEDFTYQAPGTDMTVAWSPATDTAALTVLNSSGEEVYDNLPRDLNGLYGFMTSSEVSSASIPGSTFAADQVYGIGVAGLVRSVVDEAHFSTNLNFLVSNAVSGTAVMTAVYTTEGMEIPTGL